MEISNYIWNMDIFLTIMHVIAIIGLYLSPGTVWGTFLYGFAHFIWRVLDCFDYNDRA